MINRHWIRRTQFTDTFIMWLPMTILSNGSIFLVTDPLCGGIPRYSVNSPHKGQWRGASMFSLTYARTNAWLNKRNAGGLRRHRAHYEVIAMQFWFSRYPNRYLVWCIASLLQEVFCRLIGIKSLLKTTLCVFVSIGPLRVKFPRLFNHIKIIQSKAFKNTIC